MCLLVGGGKQIWIEVSDKEKNQLTEELSDGFFAFLYPYAMLRGMNMEFKGNISEDILYKFNRQLMPILADNNSLYHRISVKAKTAVHCFTGTSVGCGFSGGVDSFCCLNRNLNSEYKNCDITHLCFFDFPIIGNDCKVDSQHYLKKAYEIELIARKKNLKFLGVSSNINDFYDEVEARWVHGAYTVGIMLCLQKSYKKYLMASDYPLAEVFELSSNFDDHFRYLVTDTFSNNNIQFIYESMDLKRTEKMKYVINDPIAHQYLNVCGYSEKTAEYVKSVFGHYARWIY